MKQSAIYQESQEHKNKQVNERKKEPPTQWQYDYDNENADLWCG